VTVAELAQRRADRWGGFPFSHWPAVRRVVFGLYLASLGAWSAHYGIPAQRELVVIWTCGALACASLGRHPRQIVRLVVDWLPLVVVLSAYDFTRGAADSLGIGVHVHPMIDFDRALFFGATPTEWLQAHLDRPGAIGWWNVAFTLTYTSYFIVPFAVAGFLWARDRLAFLRFRMRLVLLALAGLATYVAFPAAPPWMAAQMGLLEGVHRTTSDGWAVLGGGTAELFSEGQAAVNLVAAVPSLHAAFSALVAAFLWPRVRPRLRWLLPLYPLAMGLALIATGEHYFFDVLLGWLYAGAVMAGCGRWERRRSRSPRLEALGGADRPSSGPSGRPSNSGAWSPLRTLSGAPDGGRVSVLEGERDPRRGLQPAGEPPAARARSSASPTGSRSASRSAPDSRPVAARTSRW
jgi:membrane-associated phospholipid phosphatase